MLPVAVVPAVATLDTLAAPAPAPCAANEVGVPDDVGVIARARASSDPLDDVGKSTPPVPIPTPIPEPEPDPDADPEDAADACDARAVLVPMNTGADTGEVADVGAVDGVAGE